MARSAAILPREANPARHHAAHHGSATGVDRAAVDLGEISLGIGIGEGGMGTGGISNSEKVGFAKDGGHFGTGQPGTMLAQQAGHRQPGEERRLPGSGLRQSVHTECSVQSHQNAILVDVAMIAGQAAP